jgi:hypothetical protein
MKMSSDDDAKVADLIERFKQAAILVHHGKFLGVAEIRKKGSAAVIAAMKELDAVGQDSRLALVPLLDSPNVNIQVYAAGYLLARMPERALPILEDIDLNCETEATMTAFHILQRYNRYNHVL